jgi:hypothetical protein
MEHIVVMLIFRVVAPWIVKQARERERERPNAQAGTKVVVMWVDGNV